MFTWASALIAAFSFARELVKYYRTKLECSEKTAQEMKRLHAAMVEANKRRDLSEVENIFKSLGASDG